LDHLKKKKKHLVDPFWHALRETIAAHLSPDFAIAQIYYFVEM